MEDLITDLSNGNFGAAKVLVDLINKKNDITILNYLKEKNLIGSKIWMFYKDVANSDVNNFISIINELQSDENYSMMIPRLGKVDKVLNYLNQ